MVLIIERGRRLSDFDTLISVRLPRTVASTISMVTREPDRPDICKVPIAERFNRLVGSAGASMLGVFTSDLHYIP